MAQPAPIARVVAPESAPRYELRVRRYGPADTEYAIWRCQPRRPRARSWPPR